MRISNLENDSFLAGKSPMIHNLTRNLKEHMEMQTDNCHSSSLSRFWTCSKVTCVVILMCLGICNVHSPAFEKRKYNIQS